MRKLASETADGRRRPVAKVVDGKACEGATGIRIARQDGRDLVDVECCVKEGLLRTMATKAVRAHTCTCTCA